MKFFRTEVREDILIAYFDDVAQSNALSVAAARELAEICKKASHKKIKGFILTSDYRIFCSGGNLTDYSKLKQRSQGMKINREITKVLKNLSEMSTPTVVLVRGDCFGGGIEWISAFDKVYALPHVLFGMWQRKIGLTWGWGGGHRLKMRLSKKDLLNLLMSTENFSAYRAQDMGLVDAIFPEETILENALAWIEMQKHLATAPIEKIKSHDLKKEKKIFEDLWMNPEHKQALKKFTSKN